MYKIGVFIIDFKRWADPGGLSESKHMKGLYKLLNVIQMSDYTMHNNLFVIIQLIKEGMHAGTGIEGRRGLQYQHVGE